MNNKLLIALILIVGQSMAMEMDISKTDLFDEQSRDMMRNEIIKGHVLDRIGPVPGRELAVCKGHKDRVLSICITPDDKIVSGSWDKTMRIWDMNGQELAVCDHQSFVSSVSVTPDSNIVSCADLTERVWDTNGKQLSVLEKIYKRSIPDGPWDNHEDKIGGLCVTPDGKLGTGYVDGTVRVWNMMNGKELAVCKGHKDLVHSVCISPDDKIVSGSRDNTMRICDMNGKELVCRDHEGWVYSVFITPDGNIVSCSASESTDDSTVRIWDMKGTELSVCRNKDWISSVCVVDNNKIAFGSRHDNTVRIWDISLLHHLSTMNNKQAQAICTLLESSPHTSPKEKELCWEGIRKIFEAEELL